MINELCFNVLIFRSEIRHKNSETKSVNHLLERVLIQRDVSYTKFRNLVYRKNETVLYNFAFTYAWFY